MPETHHLPERLTAVSTDKLGFALKELMDYQIHFIAKFRGRLDPLRMEGAMRCLYRAEPVMGSRFVPHPMRPWWEPARGLRREKFLSFKEGGDEQLMEFIAEPFDFYSAPQVRACIVSSQESDTLCLKFSHVPTDGASVKEGAYLIAEFYKRLGADPGFSPEPNISGSRSARQISSRFGFMDKLRMLRRYIRNESLKKGAWATFPVSGPVSDAASEQKNPRRVRITVSKEKFRKLKSIGRESGATINDLLITALYRSLHKIIGQAPGKPMGIMTTADLRRYLPERKTEGLCCLSAFFFSNIGTELGGDFSETLMKVRQDTKFQKGDFLGLGDYPALAFFMNLLPYFIGLNTLKALFKIEMKPGGSKVGLTNLGIIDENLLDFGQPEVTDAFIQVPLSIMLEKIFITGVTTFREKISISAGFLGSEEDHALISDILEAMEKELPG